MRRILCFSRYRLAAILLSAISLYGVSVATPAAEPDHEGVATCASTTCHGAARPLTGTPVLQNEYVTWSEFDPHSSAFRTLRDERSAAIARRLGLGPADQAPACLACHAEVVPAALRGPKFQEDDGIGCEACHGAAQQWLASHDDGGPETHAASLRAGLRALDEPSVLADVCTACHVGTGDRQATHAMMAAGHPRLSFELDTFTELWRTSGGREHFRRAVGPAVGKPDASAPQVWLAGLVAASLASVDQVQKAVGAGALPEFSAFNCYSCHRNMGRGQRDVVRPAAGAATPATMPGTLRLNDSALLLLATAVQAGNTAPGNSLFQGLAELQRAANENRAAVAPAADALRRQLETVRAGLGATPGQSPDGHALLAALLRASAEGAFPDYATAEQAAMAAVVLLAGTQETASHKVGIDALFASLDDDTAFDQVRFARMLSRVGEVAKPGK